MRGPILVLMLTFLVAFAACPLFAAAASEEEVPVTIELRDAPLEDALQMIFNYRPDANFVLSEEARGKQVVRLSLTDVPFSYALRHVLDSLGLTYRKEEPNTYVIIASKEPTPVSSAAAGGAEKPTARRLHFIGPGGRYELKYLDAVQVASWFWGFPMGASIGIRTVGQPSNLGTGISGTSWGGGSTGVGTGSTTGFGTGSTTGFGTGSTGFGTGTTGYGTGTTGFTAPAP
jgi:hypothetical protein